MPWKLRIHDQTKTNLLHELTPAAPGGLDAGFTWQTDGYGNVIRLEVQGRNDTLTLPPRGVLELLDGADALAFGIAPDVPSLDSPDAETITADGGREALRVALMDATVYRNAGVFSIVRDVLTRLCPPCLRFDATLIGDGTGTDAGPSLGTYYAPTASLADVLDGLAKAVQTQWAVNARGLVEFGRPAPAPLVIPFAGQPWRRLQVQGRETVTQAVIRVVSGGTDENLIARIAYETVGGVARRVDYVPATLTKTATAPEHAQFSATAAFDAPEGVSMTKRSLGQGVYVHAGAFTDPQLASDGDPATAATPEAAGIRPILAAYSAPGERVIGLHARYSLTENAPDLGEFLVQIVHDNANGTRNVVGAWNLATGSSVDAYFLLPPHALGAGPHTSWASIEGGPNFTAGQFRIFEFNLVVIDEAVAQRVAESSLQVPFSRPAEIVLPGIVPPRPAVTVTGTPDGDVTGPAPLWEYSISRDGGRQTKVRIGATGQDQTVRALKWAVKQ